MLALAATLLFTGCGVGTNDATFGERQELANITPNLMVPATRPASLIASFKRYCVEMPSDSAARTAQLRATDYIPMGGWINGFRSFVVADMRPMVILTEDGKRCAVRARARTGQTSAISREIARTWPAARQISPPRRYEAAWETSPGQAEVIGLLRHAGGPSQNEITLVLTRR
ncbi:MAG: hypothetical protein ACK41U_07590 [Paracoccus sp. (in: a-proteobacteria)]|uniref:hypothetical protein n=1 Tax=Paracoccus sp. TaxID=267 RepID=UPI003919E1B8